MSHPLPNSPIDLRALVLYDNYQQKTAEKSYKNYEKLCETMGEKAISNEDFKYWFKAFIDDEWHIIKTKNDRYPPTPYIPDIRGCILSDVIDKKSAKKSIDDLSYALIFDTIDKADHDYWYNRFKNRHFVTRVIFSNLPDEIIAKIVGKCDFNSHVSLRNVSQGLRTIVDQKTPECTEISVNCGDDTIEINAENSFSVNLRDCSQKFQIDLPEKRLLIDLKFLLNNPKLRLKSFDFKAIPIYNCNKVVPSFEMNQTGLSYKKHFLKLLSLLNHKLQVEKCVINVGNEKDLIGILQCLKPGALKNLDIKRQFSRFSRHNINRIVEMDQWKQAKHLKLDGFSLSSIEHLLHFKTIETAYRTISMEDLVHLCNNLSESINFELFTMRTMRTDEILDTGTIKEVLNLQQSDSPHTFLIPDSNLIVEFSLDSEIMKLSKNSV